ASRITFCRIEAGTQSRRWSRALRERNARPFLDEVTRRDERGWTPGGAEVRISRSRMNATQKYPEKQDGLEWRGTWVLNSWEGGIAHETSIRSVVLVARVHPFRSGRLRGGR